MAWVQYNSIKLQITIGSFQQVIQNKIVLEFHLYLFRLERSSWECSAKIANQLIQEVWAADSATCRTTPNTGTVQGSSSALLQCYRCINHNPLISYSSRQLSVCLQASCSIFIKGASLLEKPRTLPFNLFLWFFFNVLFNGQYLQHSEYRKSGFGLTEEGYVHERWNEKSVRDSL